MPQTLVGLEAGDPLETITHYVVNVAKTSTLVVPKQEGRRYLLLINDSNETIYISHNVEASLNFGIRIEKNGGRLEMSLMNGSICCQSLYAIQATNTPKRLLVTEGH